MIASDLHLNQTAVLPKHEKATTSIKVGFQTTQVRVFRAYLW